MESLSPAKVNIFLDITGKRSDGYHNILSLFQTVSLYDIIKIESIPENDIILSCNIQEISGRKNLCYKIAELIKKRYKIKTGLKIEIIKNIPIGSGLGGGSSNVFTTLTLIQNLWRLNFSKKEILSLCAEIGKDVPYFFYKGCCIVESTGEKVTRIIPYWENQPYWFLLVYPGKGLSTKKVYLQYDKMFPVVNPCFTKTSFLKYIKIANIDQLIYNVLTPAAVSLYPEMGKIKMVLEDISKKPVGMSGSGSTLFTIFRTRKEAKEVKKEIIKKYKNCSVYITKPIF